MRIKISSPNQFNSLLNALAGEIVDAEGFFKLHLDLLAAVPDYKKVFNQSNTFWSLTVHALLDATLSRLCRIYDEHPKSLSLQNLLDTIKANLEIFDTENFRERLRDNPFVESLAQTARKPDSNVLAQDMRSVNNVDPLVKQLLVWRNNIIAHKSATNVIKNKDIIKDYPLTKDEVTQLLNRATSILNRYSGLFRAATYSIQVVGHDDYLYILECIQEKQRKRREQLDAEIARLRQKNTLQKNEKVA